MSPHWRFNQAGMGVASTMIICSEAFSGYP